MEYYTSELIEKILVDNPKAKEILRWMPPRYASAYVFLNLLNQIGLSIGRMETWANDVRNQVVPQTATWSIEYWEDRYGIIPNENLTIEQRRSQVVNKRITRAPMIPYKLEEIVSNITGVPTQIQENTGRNHFTVVCIGYVNQATMKAVRKEIDRVKPSHLVYTITSSIYYDTDTTQYKAAAPAVKKIYDVREVIA